MPGLPKAIPARDIFFSKYEAGVVLLDDCKPHGNCVDPPSDLFFPSPDSKSRTTVRGSVKVNESKRESGLFSAVDTIHTTGWLSSSILVTSPFLF